MTFRSLLLGAMALASVAAASPAPPPEPDDLWSGPAHGATPATLRGATVLDPAGLERVIAADRPVLIDVASADQRPPGLAPTAPWLPQHHTIPGAIWLPGAGAVPLSTPDETRFAKQIADLTAGDRERAIVSFCHVQCWASWNAAKRLVTAGYRRVYWFPAGVEGWRDAHPTAVVETAW